MVCRVALEGRRWEVKCCHNPRLRVQIINKSSAAEREEAGRVIDSKGGGGCISPEEEEELTTIQRVYNHCWISTSGVGVGELQ